MKTEYMREFILLSETLNFTVAADRLFISQSTLSRHLAAMEHELGCPLLLTSSHGVRLTPEGEDTLQTFREILKDYEALLSRNQTANSTYTGTIRFGMMYYLLDEGYVDFIDSFQNQYPGVEVICLTNYQPQTLYDDLLCGKVDIATLNKSRNPLSANLRFQRIQTMSTVVMVRDTSPLASRSSLRLDDLKGMSLVRLKHDHYSDAHIQDMLQRHHFKPDAEIYADNIETVPSKLRHGNAFHITGEKCRKQQAKGISYIPLDEKQASFDMGIMAVDRKDELIDLFFSEIRQFFVGR